MPRIPSRSRLRRKRGALGLALECCEQVAAGDGSALLRVSGRWQPYTPEAVVLRVGGEAFDRLPAPAAGDGSWNAAFAVPAGLLADEEATLVLAAPDSAEVEIPHPRARALAKERTPAAAPLDELAAERRARVEAEQRLEDTLEELRDASGLVRQLRKRCELSERGLAESRTKLVEAWGETATMRQLLDEREAVHAAAKERARDAAAEVATVEAQLREREADLSARRAELEAHCGRLSEELAARVRSERDARAAADQAGEREAVLQADAADALVRFERSRAEASEARERLDEERERLATVEREAADLRESYDRNITALAQSEQALRQELDSLSRTDIGDGEGPRGPLGRRRTKVAARAYREVVAELEREREARGSAEDEAAALAEQVSALESRVAEVTAAPAEPAPAEPVSLPWTAIDEELVDRIARAKTLAGQ